MSYSNCTTAVWLHLWKGMFCHAHACTMLPAEQRALMEQSRGAQHHECPLWASPRSNSELLISHWINFNLSKYLFCNTVYGRAQCWADNYVKPSLLTVEPLLSLLPTKTSPLFALQNKTVHLWKAPEGKQRECWEESWPCTLLNFQWHW